MAQFNVSLSNTPADSMWGEKAPISFAQAGAIIHLSSVDDELSVIARAARRLDSMNILDVKLVGEWSFEQQWTFAQSYTRARNFGLVEWADTADRERIEMFYQTMLVTRGLVNDTPEDLSPVNLANRAADWLKSLAPEQVSFSQLVGKELVENGWHGIYQVGRGSERPPVMLELDYNPTGNEDAPVEYALVGKGVTFDSGGYSIKSSEGMLSMKCDMGGAATVTGALGLAIQQGLNKRVKLLLCCVENLISGHAYKLGDVITYKNGVSVEVVNTDAEGRLILADGLMRAAELGAQVTIDAATLTGAAHVALGSEYHAVFSLDDELAHTALATAAKENELFWRLPLAPWHQHRCPSAFADTANSRPQKGGGAGGASNAAGFLSRFVANNGKGWLHLDLAAAYNGSATAELPEGATAMGVRTIAAIMRAD